MTSEYLYYPEDFTISGNVVTLTAVPDPTILHEIQYSYIPEGESRHKHNKEVKSNWSGAENTWNLTYIPNIGELKHWRFPADALLWIAYTDDPPTDELYVRQAAISGPEGAKTLVWTCDPIVIPYSSGAITCMGSNSATSCFVATNGTPGGTQTIKVYKVNRTTELATEVFSEATTTSDTQIKVIWPYENASNVYFCVHYDSGVFNAALHGVWKSTDGGSTFAYLHQGYNATASLGVHALAVTNTGPQSGRIYTVHTNTGAGVVCVLSYSDDDGVTWTDVANSALNQFATGKYGFISLYPVDDGSSKVYYSVANGGGGIQNSYFVPGTGVTLNPQNTDILDSAFVEHSYYLTANQRILIQGDSLDSSVWLSTDAGATWSDVAFDNILTDIYDRYHLFSMLPSKDYFVITTFNLEAIHLSTVLGEWQNLTLDLAGSYLSRAVAWVGGRN